MNKNVSCNIFAHGQNSNTKVIYKKISKANKIYKSKIHSIKEKYDKYQKTTLTLKTYQPSIIKNYEQSRRIK